MNISFADPQLLIILVLVLPLVLKRLWVPRGYGLSSMKYSYTDLVSNSKVSWKIRCLGVLSGLRVLTLVLVVIAIARPQLGEASEIIESEGIDIALALDISGSMQTVDSDYLSRFEIAKQVVTDFIDGRNEDRIGLIVFAHEAFVQSPPTVDHRNLQFFLKEIQTAPESGLSDGTAIGMGLASAVNLLKDSPIKSRVVILLTDGVNNSGLIDPLTAASAAKALDVKVYLVNVANTGSGQSTNVEETTGNISMNDTDLADTTLTQIAKLTGGVSFAVSDSEDLQSIYEEINALETDQIETRMITRYEELVKWFLIPAVTLILLEIFLRTTIFRVLP